MSAIGFLFLAGQAEVYGGSGQVKEAGRCSQGAAAMAPDHPASLSALPAVPSQVLRQPADLCPDPGPSLLGVALVCKQPKEVLTLWINQPPTALGS